MRIAHPVAFTITNGHSYRNGYRNADSNRNRNSYGHSYGYRNSDSDCNCHIYANSYSYGYGNGYCHGNSNANCNCIAAAYTHATASAHTGASSLALFGIRGTRQNELASSQVQRCSKSLTNAGRAIYKGVRSASSGFLK
jgi:hypothetical protein